MSDVNKLAAGLNLTDEQVTQLVKNLNELQSNTLLELAENVARTKEGSVITRNGLDLLAQAVAGKKLIFTRVQMGDGIKNGKIAEPTEEEQINFTNLINPKNLSLPIIEAKFSGNGTAVLKFLLNNSTLEQGFFGRELGVYAKIEGGKEVLYCYKNFSTLASYIPGGGEGSAVALDLRVSVVTVIDQATQVTAIVDTALVNVSAAEFDLHVNSTTPHPNIPNKRAEVSSSDYIWATSSDNQLHPIKMDNLSAQILGSNLNRLSTLTDRVSQTEINIANLFMQLDSEKNLGLDANLLIFEDFIDLDATDLFKVKCRDEVAGARNICVDSIDGLQEGHYYMLSDGVRSQYVRVSSVAKNDDLYVIFFDEDLAHTFDLTKTYLYRTTCEISAGAKGSGDVSEMNLDFSETVWKGESSSEAQTLTLAYTQKNKKSFSLSGDWAFADGFFTISN